MKRTIQIFLGAALLGVLGSASPGFAQSPDIRSIPPVVMLLVDSSGSMERMGNCACTTPTCDNCLPQCTPGSSQKNRWTTVVEALTGTIQNFSCERVVRRGTEFNGEPDENYYLPHFAPVRNCTGELCQEDNGVLDIYDNRVRFGLMTYDGVNSVNSLGQLTTQARWVSDGLGECNDGSCPEGRPEGGYSYGENQPYVFQDCNSIYALDNGARNEGVRTAMPGGGPVVSSVPGGLVSIGSTSLDGRDDSTNFADVNDAIQTALTGPQMRPYGATPIAGMLTDVEYYFENHEDVRPVSGGIGDPFAACRPRYAILITDGRPNMDMRDGPFYCGSAITEATALGVTDPCPYETPVTVAEDLVDTGRTGGQLLEGLYVVGFNVDARNCSTLVAGTPEYLSCMEEVNDAVASLEDLADAGDTDDAIFVDADTDSLRAAVSNILDATAPGTTTRTVPAVANVGVGGGGSQQQLRFKTGFLVAGRGDDTDSLRAAWEGALDLETISCPPVTSDPHIRRQIGEGSHPIDVDDPEYRFHIGLNCVGRGANERGNCAPGSGASGAPNTQPQNILGAAVGAGDNPALSIEGNHGVASLNDVGQNTVGTRAGRNAATAPIQSIRDDAFGVSDNQALLDWLDGAAGSRREGNRFGAVVHSSPVLHGPPPRDIPDESFNLFRTKPGVFDRPTMVYVGTNDGLIRGFVANASRTDSSHPTNPNQDVRRGQQLFAFMPPMLMPELEELSNGILRYGVDGTPVVNDVFFARPTQGDPNRDLYHTVLLASLRGGGNGFVAIDVTNPFVPEFLWQHTDPNFGQTYGQPALTHTLVRTAGTPVERSIAILPGGQGELRSPGGCDVTNSASRPSEVFDGDYHDRGTGGANVGSPVTNRSQRRCWENRGRELHIVDTATGAVLRHWGPETFHSPLDGGVAPFPSATGAIADRAFFTDADGVIWRLNMASPNPADWEVKAFHDIFHDRAYDAGQPAYHPPVLSTLPSGEVVVIQGTGQIDVFDDPGVQNRIVSLLETISVEDNRRADDVSSQLNWEVDLGLGEQVTGRPTIFNSRAYWGTFTSSTSVEDACQLGFSRLFGVDYADREDTAFLRPAPGLTSTPGARDPDVQYIQPGAPVPPATGSAPPILAGGYLPPGEDPSLYNRLLMGVAVTSLPTCFEGGEASENDPYIPGSRATYRIQQRSAPTYELTALLSGGNERGGDVQEYTRELPPPIAGTRVEAYTGVVE